MVGRCHAERGRQRNLHVNDALDNRRQFATMAAHLLKGITMAEETQPPADAQGVQVVLDEREMRTVFSNAYRIHTTAEEVVLDFGFNMANPNPQQGGQQQLLFKVSDRVIMSYANVKRLTASLTQLVRRYEQQFGELQTQPGQPAHQGQAGQPQGPRPAR